MLATTKVNNKVVKAIPIDDSKKDRRPVKGVDVCSEVYANIALIAKKKKGKTSIIYKLIQECAGRDTNVIAFVSTLIKMHNGQSSKNTVKRKEFRSLDTHLCTTKRRWICWLLSLPIFRKRR